MIHGMRPVRLSWIIHIFAILHAAVALGCRFAGIDDQLLLTILTMALSLIICMKMGLKIEFTVAVVITVNILGFLIGTWGARVLQSLIHSEHVVHCLSTFVTTEILGWCIVAISNIFRQKNDRNEQVKSSPYMKWLLLTASAIFFMRLLIVLFMSKSTFEQEEIFDMVGKVAGNTFSLIILICVNVLFVRSLASRDKKSSRLSTIFLYVSFMLLSTMLEVFLVGIEEERFMPIFTVSFIIQITVYCIVYIINYALTARSEMQVEREKANMAQYRYVKLKRQVNPHFLFNSLNILDCLICEEKTEQASVYTHKLAGLYRYMIKSEDEDVVPLREELSFVNQYVDLLKVRFPEGFEVRIDVDEELMTRYLPPCSLQLLIENATKHNTVSIDNPLIVNVSSEGESIRVSNNVIPKMTQATSTGLGQNYIRQLYLDLSGKAIAIDKTDDNYSVTLPLL